MSVSFFYEPNSKYPKSHLYNPNKKYPEYPFNDIGEKNDVYEMIREVFILHNLDMEHVNTREWNPLGYAIKPGNTVLIKPNLVRDINPAESEYVKGMECLITHPSVTRCVFDYVYIALKGHGRIIIADAPVQGCDYDNLLSQTGYGELFDFFESCQTSELRIETADLRERIWKRGNDLPIQVSNPYKKFQGMVVDLEERSYFQDVRKKRGLRVTGYVGADTASHHRNGKNEYCISEAALLADVIINLPKPKTHRIAGYTGALKNLIGVNAEKEYLPHHRKGTDRHGGDEYTYGHSFLKAVNSWANDGLNVAIKKQSVRLHKVLNMVGRISGRKLLCYEKNRKRNGMWHGNDTIWRTILDINKIILYSDKNGVLQEQRQRKIISLGDMIVCGEKEGPLEPSYKYVGGILFSDNSVLFDLFVVKIMGFSYKKFKVLKNALKDDCIFKNSCCVVHSNDTTFENDIFEPLDRFCFRPTNGWSDYL